MWSRGTATRRPAGNRGKCATGPMGEARVLPGCLLRLTWGAPAAPLNARSTALPTHPRWSLKAVSSRSTWRPISSLPSHSEPSSSTTASVWQDACSWRIDLLEGNTGASSAATQGLHQLPGEVQECSMGMVVLQQTGRARAPSPPICFPPVINACTPMWSTVTCLADPQPSSPHPRLSFTHPHTHKHLLAAQQRSPLFSPHLHTSPAT